ncbi:VMAP-C domain-containing protein [Nocardiopsis baichengensis]|uniref:VMAP-C domain-containing protein n=1 Tax=Nocardiopsis baichengensis TaxID=280240 RepID=UPI0003476F6E|nr:trypsin-like peptidase domain-containing protein [Nocardiopsis baichengensis]
MRIPTLGGAVAGGGVVVPGGRILTCAHVVDAALERRPGRTPSPPPDAAVPVEVPGAGGFVPRTARVDPRAWNPAGDTAVLLLDPAPGAPAPEPAVLRGFMERIRRTRRPRAVQVRGHPALYAAQAPLGLSAFGRVVGPGVRFGTAQLDLDPDAPMGIMPGFSGCGVLDVEEGAVMGIVGQALLGPGGEGARLAAVVPVEAVSALAPLVADSPRERLERALASLPFAEVTAAYATATAARPLEHVRFGTALEAFDRLAELAPGGDGLPREVVFTEEAAKLGAADAAVLRAYADSRPESEVPRAALARLRARTAAPDPPSGARLELTAEPVPGPGGGAPCRYELRARLRAAGTVTARPARRVGADRLRPAALEAISEAERLLEQHSRPQAPALSLHFTLPFDLLISGAIPHWRTRTPLSPYGERLGTAHEIVLHSFERLQARQWSGARLRMERRAALLSGSGHGRVRRIDARHGGTAPAHDRLADPAIAVCVLVGGDARELRGALAAALESGVPAVLWQAPGRRPRAAADPAADRESPSAVPPLAEHAAFDTLISREFDWLTREEISGLSRRLREWRIDSTDTDISDETHTRTGDPFDIALLSDLTGPAAEERPGVIAAPEEIPDSE